ncbi:FtsX-like permease family protein [Inediibacterium massiliense]|uniref:FtsX-like permease family protein n=1 Tax=Inediibacterium massiliense TaxID=1658111 RepID=UPI0006B4C44C|nr:ABC transporter permease [Inediibacterium massiliense]
MYFKLAMNNIKKSFKNYAIYFITLTLAVCIFYNFNSIDNQAAMENINKVKMLMKAISYISIFISIIFGGLMLYANNALVKKRKKELGIYAILGMTKRKVSQILIYETLIVGGMSLIIGILMGILLSQGMSALTGKLFEFNMSEYQFIISMSAIYKTCMYFGIMFMLVMIFNKIVVSRHKLIDMIYASKKNEEIKVKNPIISVIIFILSLMVLGRGYYLAWKYSLTPKNINFPASILWGSFGTLLFFFGLAGFIFIVLRNRKQIYFKQLNMFVIKQFARKINTNFISMSIICLMLFTTINLLSFSLMMKYETEKIFKNSMSLDAKIELNIDEKQEVRDIKEALKRVGFKYNDFEYVVLDDYVTNMKIATLLNDYANENLKKELTDYHGILGLRKISQYNEMRKLKGEKPIDLKENEILLLTNNDDENEAIQNIIKSKKTININKKSYSIKNNIGIKGIDSRLIAIVDDDATKNMIKTFSTMEIKANEKNKERLEEQIKEIKTKFKDVSYHYDELFNQYGFIMYADTKMQIYDEAKGVIGTLVYIGIYIGFVFLIASAAVLAIQQLTEASDSISRYIALKKIGVSDDMINKSIFVQVVLLY